MNRIIIIGAVAAGLKSAAKIRREDPAAEIIVLEKGSLISYGACGMPFYVGGLIADISDFVKTTAGAVRNPEFFKQDKDVDVRIRMLVTAINREAKTVTAKNLDSGAETVFPYDKLVIATGARASVPPNQCPRIHLSAAHPVTPPSRGRWTAASTMRCSTDSGSVHAGT